MGFENEKYKIAAIVFFAVLTLMLTFGKAIYII